MRGGVRDHKGIQYTLAGVRRDDPASLHGCMECGKPLLSDQRLLLVFVHVDGRSYTQLAHEDCMAGE